MNIVEFLADPRLVLVLAMLGAGLFAGLVAGMFGIGGGFVVVPALVALFSLLKTSGADGDRIMHVAVGTSLATIIFTSLSSVRAHARRGAVDFAILKGWTPWVAAGVIAGVFVASRLDAHAMKIAFGVGVMLMGAHFIYPVIGRHKPETENMPKGALRASLGASLGAYSSVLGIGGGTPAVLIMTLSGVAIHRAVATAAGFGAIIAIPGAIANMAIGYGQPGLPYGSVGYVNLIGMVAISAASMLTAPIGASLAHSLNPVRLKRVFGIYLVLTAAWMLHDAIKLPHRAALAASVAASSTP